MNKIKRLKLSSERRSILRVLPSGRVNIPKKNFRGLKRVNIGIKILKVEKEKMDIKKRKKNTKLTEKNIQLIKYIAQGYTDKEIAEKLEITAYTVKNVAYTLLEKTGTANRPSLVYWACKKGILN